MKTLVLITSHFPFGTSEPYIGTELMVLSQNFDKVLLIAQDTKGTDKRFVPDNVSIFRYNPASSVKDFLYLPILFILNYKTVSMLLSGEFIFRRNTGYILTFKKQISLSKRIIKAIQLRDFIINILTENNTNENIVFYSYWLKTPAIAISMLEYKKSIRIARAHGSDIYEENSPSGFLPLQNYMANNLNSVFFVSKQGEKYLTDKLKIVSDKFIVSYLGVHKPKSKNQVPERSEKFRIVSCSNLVPLKRIDLIIQALELLNGGKEISWLHFGDGVLKEKLEALAAERLGPQHSVSYSFMGHFPNDELLDFYNRERVDLFINTSSTEGLPVSIMEAQCFGIPVIATDVGGMKEVVTEGTGSLIPVDFNPNELTILIDYYINLNEVDIEKIRVKAKNNWNSNFNADLNYNNFIQKVNSILASAN